MLRYLARQRWFWLILLLGTLGTALVAWQFRSHLNPEDLKAALSQLIAFLENHPALLFVSMVILPGVGFPVSALLVVAGAVYGKLAGSLLSLLAVGMNMSWTWWIAAYPGRATIDAWLRKAGRPIPEVSAEHRSRIVMLVRVTPGLPLMIQNYILGVIRIPFRIYILVSLLFQGLFTVGLVVFGQALFQGKGKVAMIAMAVLVFAVVLTKWIRSRISREDGPKPSITAEPPTA